MCCLMPKYFPNYRRYNFHVEENDGKRFIYWGPKATNLLGYSLVATS